MFVGPDCAWKLRKAVRLPYVDFTSCAARKAAALREFELNAGWAPTLYRRVATITQQPDGPALDGDGPVIDHVVLMAPVAAGDFLITQAHRQGLGPDTLDGLGDLVAAMHQTLPRSDAAPAIVAMAAGNAETALKAGLPPARINAWHDAMAARLQALAPWMAQRSRDGFIRRCHGDLHLGNLCRHQGALLAFDALEFREDMAIIDVGYDLAFLLMDLDLRVGRAAANRVLNRYLARTGDVGLLAGLGAFLSQRALVRAHLCRNSGEPWDAYLDYAEASLRPTRPVAIAIGGLPGTGKSTLARHLAPSIGAAPGAVILRSDEIRKRQHGVAPEQRLDREAYAPSATQRMLDRLFADLRTVLDAGHAVIADMSFGAPHFRTRMTEVAGATPLVAVWLTAPLDVLEARVAARIGDASDATIDTLHHFAATDPGPIAWPKLDATHPNLVDQLARLVRNAVGSC